MAALYNDAILSIMRFLPARDLLLTQSRVCKGWAALAQTAARLENTLPGVQTWKGLLAPMWTVVDPLGGSDEWAGAISFVRTSPTEIRIVGMGGFMPDQATIVPYMASLNAQFPHRRHIMVSMDIFGQMTFDFLKLRCEGSADKALLHRVTIADREWADRLTATISGCTPELQQSWTDLSAINKRWTIGALHPLW